jgi:hypothetical protein
MLLISREIKTRDDSPRRQSIALPEQERQLSAKTLRQLASSLSSSRIGMIRDPPHHQQGLSKRIAGCRRTALTVSSRQQFKRGVKPTWTST